MSRAFAPASTESRRQFLRAMGAIGGICGGCFGVAPARAAASYPAKPVRVVVPFVAGGGGDVLARLALTPLSETLNQVFVFDNVSGAGGNIGSANAARATPDGYTLLYGTNGTFAINHALYKHTGFDPIKDFMPVSQLSRIATIVVVRPNFPAKTMQELIAALKASPGKYTFASAGNGTTSHLAGEMLKSAANVDMVHVPYRGGAPAMTDLIAGQVDMMIEISANAAPQVKGGRVRALAVSTAQRIASFPDLPTIAESGVPGFDVSAWDGLFAPAGTPPEVIEVLSAGLRKALATPELKQQFQDRGAEIALSSPAALGAFVSSEYKRWGDAVRRSGASVD